MLSEPHLICIDIDGTLTTDFEGTVPAENADAIRKAHALGHKVAVNTGRSYFNLPPKLLSPELPLDCLICANGSYIRLGGETVRNVTFPPQLAHELLSYFLFEDERFALFEGETLLLKTRHSSPLYGSPGVQIFHPDELQTRFGGAGLNDMSCEGMLPDAFLDRFAGRVETFACGTFTDVTVPGCSKAVGMALAAECLGIPETRTVAIGDSGNDLPMLRKAAVAVAMGNASEAVKREADLVTRGNDDAGVADAIRKLFF